MSSGRVTFLIVLAGAVAIIAVVVSSGEIDLSGGDEQRTEPSRAAAQPEAERDQSDPPAAREPREPELPASPDDVRGSDPVSLTKPANLRRALAVLERERQAAVGVYDGLRVAPGRIDTVIVHPDDRRTNIQVRPDLEVSFKSTHDFPTPADFRRDGITARDVDVAATARLLREIDRMRDGSAAHDIDYVVIDRDRVDGGLRLGAYMRVRTPRPRAFSKEAGEGVRVVG